MAVSDDLHVTTRLLSDLLAVGWFSIPVAALFGFFEARTDGDYHFRFRRFFLCVAIMVMASIGLAVIIEQQIGSSLEKPEVTAENLVAKNRAVADYSLHFITILFPDALNDDVGECYRRGLSNYIEDHWSSAVQEETCGFKNDHYCANSETELYKKIADFRLYHSLSWDLSAESVMLGTVWQSASSFYTLLRRMDHTPPTNGKFYDPPDDAMLADYQRHIIDCKNYPSLSWADPHAELMQSHLHVCWGFCP